LAIGALLALAAIPSWTTTSSAATKIRQYEGETSQNQPFFISTIESNGSWALFEGDTELKLRCGDDTKFRVTLSFGFDGSVPLDENNRFSVDEVDPFGAFHMSGRIGAKKGSGRIALTLPALTAEEEPQLCTSKEREWNVERSSDAAVPDEASPARSVRISIDANGAAHIAASWR
jgi:hypothetical protein